jgi:hypothetical protein
LAQSLRHGATTRATEAGVLQPDIDWMNHWNTKGSELINGPMHGVYAEQKQLLSTYLCFSQVLSLEPQDFLKTMHIQKQASPFG